MDELQGNQEDGPVDDIERRLRKNRAELSDLDLDRVKRTVMQRSARSGRRWMNPRSKLLTLLLSVALVGAGGGAVLAAGGGSSSHGSSANSQYCPHSNKPKHDTGPGHEKGGNKCGHDNDRGNDDGHANR
jgi:hypothetical protein